MTAKTLIWVHDHAISPDDVTLRSDPTAVVVFVMDSALIGSPKPAFHRLRFLWDGVVELFRGIPNPVKELRKGNCVVELLAAAQEHGCTRMMVTDHPSPPIQAVIAAMRAKMPVQVLPRPQLTQYRDEPKRFTRYWDKVAKEVLGYQPRKAQRFHKN
ncbi:hypothetical protein [Tuwongella immobilis]|uniref:Uncharacterized protein n=1 Tax=Tuwongella immobilis TaxID=692036 RepID=A0A6C2YX97_9BACT|nr:hypothetical protein [Tuwongella immobilis]VIP05425.1 Uncharacterized protein OS=Chloracidobacterium thermophilum (strain B) GN=Cabther_A2174 PE=4 SV=1 [Tuwongella immobilis]VTS08206.1 Uncharacterized protein OS=Chloracidobacterium thermophilum (strain B) GN=Cabther_A2174 PE=4 SV=1 [Tuwongella immobilis]